jgi:hypothetical protein
VATQQELFWAQGPAAVAVVDAAGFAAAFAVAAASSDAAVAAPNQKQPVLCARERQQQRIIRTQDTLLALMPAMSVVEGGLP